MQANHDHLAIEVHDLYKSFDLPEHKINSLKQLFVGLGRRRKKLRQDVLKGISFQVAKGEFLGIVGRNGSGKSTLLKVLAGVYTPDSGAVTLYGDLTPFIELGVGFNPELSARDNVYLNTSLLGYTHKQTDEMYEEIVRFAELQEHMDKKLKNYSSGMQVRLAFSIAIKAKNDILIFDEVLAVGDVNFQKKCFRHFTELKENGQTVVFVSHSMEQIRDYCTRVVVLDGGRILFDGDPEEAIYDYDLLNEDIAPVEDVEEEVSYTSGSGQAHIRQIDLSKKEYGLHDDMIATIRYDTNSDISKLFYGLSVYKADRTQSVFAISGSLDPRKTKVEITLRNLVLTPGSYYVSFGLTNVPDNWKTHYDLWEKQAEFDVEGIKKREIEYLGPVYMEVEVANEG